MAAPVTSPRGAWVCLFGLTFMLVLCAAAALPYPPPTQSSTSRHTVRYVALGGVVGLAWACALRGFMAEVAGTESGVDWVGTFVFILLPGLLVGGLLGWAAHLRATGDPRYRKRLALSPLLFSAVLFSDPSDPLAILEDGVGAGALAVPLIAIAGGYAVCGRGSALPRAVAGAVALSSVPIWALTATSVGGPGFALGTPHGLWAAVLYLGLLAALALGASIPLRHAVGETGRCGHQQPGAVSGPSARADFAAPSTPVCPSHQGVLGAGTGVCRGRRTGTPWAPDVGVATAIHTPHVASPSRHTSLI